MIVPRVEFLGFCERGRYQQTDSPYYSHYDLIGLRSIFFSYIYPFPLEGFLCVLSFYNPNEKNLGYIVIRDANGKQVFRIDITSSITNDVEMISKSATGKTPNMIMPLAGIPSWTNIAVEIKDIIITAPQTLSVFYIEQTNEYTIGQIIFGIALIPQFTPDRIAAIKSDPQASKTAVLILGCKNCSKKLSIYTALERIKDPPASAIWYQDIPDEFVCDCKSTAFSLKHIKTNMHALLGERKSPTGNISFTALYEKRALNIIVQSFLDLLKKKPKEELLQEFINNHTVLFHQWSPERIFIKPPILSKFKADYIILDSKGNLLFIELERADLRLLTKKGEVSSEFTHASEQVQSWLFVYSQYQSAVLECLNLKPGDVNHVKGIVIAGRDRDYDSKHLQIFKWQDRGQIEFQTYDDLIASLGSLVQQIEKI